MIIESLKQIVHQNRESPPLYLRNLLKEKLQFYVLNFIYTSNWGESLLFKGGSCLRMFFQLPRISEDLDVDILRKKGFFLNDFLTDLKKYFRQILQYKDLEIKTSRKKNIVYLKFPLLDELDLVKNEAKTKVLFLRIDLALALGTKYKIELSIQSTDDFSFLVRHYSLSDLFAGKIAAILQRTTRERKKAKPRFKGRDYFDLVWFLENKTPLNFSYLKELIEVQDKTALQKMLNEKIEQLDLKNLKDDIQPLFKNSNFVKDFTGNYKKIANRLLKRTQFN